MKLSIIIPCYNEKSTIENIVAAVRAAPVSDKEIIVCQFIYTFACNYIVLRQCYGFAINHFNNISSNFFEILRIK